MLRSYIAADEPSTGRIKALEGGRDKAASALTFEVELPAYCSLRGYTHATDQVGVWGDM